MTDLTINNDSKNSLSITNESKPTTGTFDQGTRTFGDGGTFGQPGTHITKESKNNLDITNETKS